MKQKLYAEAARYVAFLLGTVLVIVGVVSVSHAVSHADTTFDSTGVFSTTTEPVLSNINASTTPDGTGATIHWMTDQLASSQIAYGTSAPATSSPYAIYSAINTASSTSHSVSISSLTPGTTYHFQVISQNNSGFTTYSSDQTFMTSVSTSTATSTASTTQPTISTVGASSSSDGTSETITWLTDIPSTSQIAYGGTAGSYANVTMADPSLVTNHSLVITGLTPTTLYHFQVMSGTASSPTSLSSDMTFTTATPPIVTVGSTTGTSTDLSGLQNQINSLQDQVTALRAQVLAILNWFSNGSTTPPGGTGTTTPTGGTGTIDQNGTSVRSGTSIDFGGRHFGIEEPVVVTLNGKTVTTAHADGGGNFSTGSLSVPSTPGTATYLFRGVHSGITGSATVTFTP